MKKILIKRVCLVTPTGERIYSTDDYIGTLSDDAILSFLHTIGQTVWIGNNLYKIHYEGNTIQHYRYEIYTITQYTKSWFDLLIDAVRRT